MRVARWGCWRCERGCERVRCVRARGSRYWGFGCRGAATGGDGGWRRLFCGCVARCGRVREAAQVTGWQRARPWSSGYSMRRCRAGTGWCGHVGDCDGWGNCDEFGLDVVCVGRECETWCREGRRSVTVVLACEMDVVALVMRVREDGVGVADVRVVGEGDEQAQSFGFGLWTIARRRETCTRMTILATRPWRRPRRRRWRWRRRRRAARAPQWQARVQVQAPRGGRATG